MGEKKTLLRVQVGNWAGVGPKVFYVARSLAVGDCIAAPRAGRIAYEIVDKHQGSAIPDREYVIARIVDMSTLRSLRIEPLEIDFHTEPTVEEATPKRPTPEVDPKGLTPETPGAKLDAGKLRAWLCVTGFANAIEQVAEVTTRGAEKYSPGGWQHVEGGVERYMEAFGRHMLALARGEEVDPDTGCLHKAQMVWNLLASLELELRANRGCRHMPAAEAEKRAANDAMLRATEARAAERRAERAEALVRAAERRAERAEAQLLQAHKAVVKIDVPTADGLTGAEAERQRQERLARAAAPAEKPVPNPKPPEGATHWYSDSSRVAFYRLNDDRVHFWLPAHDVLGDRNAGKWAAGPGGWTRDLYHISSYVPHPEGGDA